MSCNTNNDCLVIDINLICSTTSNKCECREDMKWNKDNLECQIYIDVDCSIFGGTSGNFNYEVDTFLSESFKNKTTSSIDVAKPSNEIVSSEDLNPKWDECVDDTEGAIKLGFINMDD